MTSTFPEHCIAFQGARRIASGSPMDVALSVKRHVDAEPAAVILVLDANTSATVELDLRGTLDDVRDRIAAATPQSSEQDRAPEPVAGQRRPGRPKLGVVGREVTLLPRHWDWLNRQPGGASVALRKLVETARRECDATDRQRSARDACCQFMTVLAGDLPNFEEASRALFAGDRDRFDEMVDFWPHDIRAHVHTLAQGAFDRGAFETKREDDA